MQNPELKGDNIISTIGQLHRRISERFPDSSLSKVCGELLELAKVSDKTVKWISKPNHLIRYITLLFLVFFVYILVYSLLHLNFEAGPFGLSELVQSSEAALNEIVLIGAGVIFLVTFETRRKRKRVITATNKLRCFAHIIDAHQLTKDPDRLSKIYSVTRNSPTHSLND